MKQRTGIREQETGECAPVRGTQSFVGVMGAVWRRPSLTGLEVAWRWFAGVLLMLMAWMVFWGYGVDIGFDATPLESATVFRPVAAIQALQAVLGPAARSALPRLHWFAPLALGIWLLLAAQGRTLLLRHLDSKLCVRRLTVLVLGALRTGLLLATWALWFRGLGFAARVAIAEPAAQGQEASLVLFAGMLIVGTLVLYVAWAVVSWPLQLAPLLAMRNDTGVVASLRAAFGSKKELRGKLVEINLVMCIVRLALIVLAMVLSASPLAFQTVATQQFFEVWWAMAVLLYLAASDYFHVVRPAAYLNLHRVYADGN